MRRADFHYDLPTELIAQAPAAERSSSRLLACDGASGGLRDLGFRDLPQLLAPGDLLVFNDTRVLPARVHGRKPTGGGVEILLERVIAPRRILAQARSSKGFRPGVAVDLPGGERATALGRDGDLYEFELSCDAVAFFETQGEMPLPPYIERPAVPRIANATRRSMRASPARWRPRRPACTSTTACSGRSSRAASRPPG